MTFGTPEFTNTNNLPEEIVIPELELKTNAEGKKYQTEKDGVYYGGDYLPMPPQEIHLDGDVPPPPTDAPNPVI